MVSRRSIGASAASGAGPIDTDIFTRGAQQASGERTVASMPRLASSAYDDRGAIRWHLAGRRERRPDGGSERFLALRLSGEIGMACTRCLERVEVQLEVEREFKLVSDEVLAEREDPDSDEYDVLTGGPRFDVAELIEDEAIMALPLAPRHDDCRLPDSSEQSDASRATRGGDVPAGGEGGAQGGEGGAHVGEGGAHVGEGAERGHGHGHGPSHTRRPFAGLDALLRGVSGAPDGPQQADADDSDERRD